MARIDVFFLGGTIGMARETGPETGSGEAAGAPSGGAVPRLSGGDLLADLDLPHGTSVIPRDTLKVGSSRITFAHLARVLAEAREAVDAGATGIVVVQGTDTMEETSYLLDLLWGAPEPLVVTGAMRNPGLAGIDGPANLAQAITLAADPVARDLGVLVVMADEVHAARFVAKRHSSAPQAFVSPDHGRLGVWVEGRHRIGIRVPRLPALPTPVLADLEPGPRVPVLLAALDDDAHWLTSLTGESCAGMVVAGFGAGHVRPDVAEEVGRIAAEVPVVLASRTGAGAVHTHTYGGPGNEEDLLARGLIGAGMLDPLKARILLRLLLAGGADRSLIESEFARG